MTDHPTRASDDRPTRGLTPVVRALIGINVAIYLLQLTVLGPDFVRQWLGFSTANLAKHWWTVGTHLVVHTTALDLALMVLPLVVFGPRLEQRWGSAEFGRFFLLCGLGGWLASLGLANNGILVGATASIVGVLVGYATEWPSEEYTFGEQLRLRASALVALLILAGVALSLSRTGSSAVALAPLGGAVMAWILTRTSAEDQLARIRQGVSQVPDIPEETPRVVPRTTRTRQQPQTVDDLIASRNAAIEASAATATAQHRDTSPRGVSDLDHLLDKISREGLAGLTRDERRLLEQRSRELRDGK